MSTSNRRAADLAPPSTPLPPGDPPPLRPLTKVKTKGPQSGEVYTRQNPLIEKGILEALRLSPDALARRIATIDYPSVQTLSFLPKGAFLPESLVYLYRHHWAVATEAFADGRLADATSHRNATAVIGEAIDHVVKRHLRKNLSNLSGPKRIDAEDEVRGHVNDTLHDLSPEGDPLESCFGLVVMRLCIDAFNTYKRRRASRESDLPEDDTTLHQGEATRSPEDAAHLASVHKQIDRVPEDERVAFRRRELDADPYAELSDELGVSKRTIRTRKNKAIHKLQTLLSDDDRPDPGA